MKPFTAEEVNIVVDCLEEFTPIEGNALASGNDEEDKKQEDWIYKELESGNPWAWCLVRITASWGNLQSSSYLGCCSYASKTDFVMSGDHQDMVDDCLTELTDLAETLQSKLNERD